MRASASSIGPPSPLQNAIDNGSDEVPEGPLAGIPDLKTYVAETEEEKLAALKLVADGIAQTRQTANRILMFHPVNFGIFLAFIAFIAQYLYRTRNNDLGVVITTSSGLVMAAMVTVRRYTNPYIALAEETHISMLEDSDVLITKFGDEVMGTVIMGWVDGETKGKRRKWRAEIKGWAVRLRYRGKGEGMALLQEAVNLAKKKDADGISFAPDHASKCLTTLIHSTRANSRQIRNAFSGTSTTDLSTSKRGRQKQSCRQCGTTMQRPQTRREDEHLDLSSLTFILIPTLFLEAILEEEDHHTLWLHD
jgi:GNAT superfamily N-acetyltransferase